MDNLLTDLEDWETLYCAGRFQKPIKILKYDSRTELAQSKNLLSVLRTALLLLPEEFSDEELFLEIAGLSYTGMVFSPKHIDRFE